MNAEIIAGNWNEVTGKIKAQWAKMTDDDVAELKGDLDQLTGQIQKIYGHTKEQAEIEFNHFKKSLVSAVSTATASVVAKTDAMIAASTEAKPVVEKK